jgi:ribosomal protein L11 methyltransferase
MSSEKPAEVTYRAHLVAEPGRAHQIAGLLSELLWPPADAVGVFDEGGGISRIEAYFSELPNQETLQALLAVQFNAETAFDLVIEPIAAAYWVSKSQAKRPAVQAGQFLIHGRHDRPRLGHRIKSIEIEAAQAFGTGHHGSTKGCLLALDRLFKRRRFRSVLDIGTGTGVLAIAAAKISRRPVFAIDIDAQAIDITRENATLNGVGGLVSVVQCAGFNHASIRRRAPLDLIMANILAKPLAELVPDMARSTETGSVVVLSGITRPQASQLAARYRSFGFVLQDKLNVGEWTTLTLRRQHH